MIEHYATHERRVSEVLASLPTPDEASRMLRDEIPVALQDQVMAAGREATAIVKDHSNSLMTMLGPVTAVHEGYEGTTRDKQIMRELYARYLVSMERGDFTICDHLVRTPAQPGVAHLALYRIQCVPCSRRVLILPPAEDEDRCDWCGIHGVDVFTPIIMQLGMLLITSDACDHCADHLQAVTGP